MARTSPRRSSAPGTDGSARRSSVPRASSAAQTSSAGRRADAPGRSDPPANSAAAGSSGPAPSSGSTRRPASLRTSGSPRNSASARGGGSALAPVAGSAFGAFLRRQLEQADLSPADFARRSGLGLSHVYQLLRGDRADPRGTTFRKVANALAMTDAQLARAVLAESGPSGAATADADSALAAAAGKPVDKATFFAIMSAFPSGVVIVATLDGHGRPRGLTCTATCSLSAEPPLLLVCVDRRSGTLAAIRGTRRFVVNYLLAGRGSLANRFASREPDKWANLPWRPTAHGLPWLYADSLAYAECALVEAVPGGDHDILIGRVEGGQPPAPGTQPLMYFRRGYATWPV